VPITGRLVADLSTTAGAHRILTVDLHAGQVQGFFTLPVDELTALPKLVQYFKDKELKEPVVVATDIGISKRARNFASGLNAPLAIVEKRRIGNNDRAEGLNIIGHVDGMPAILFDDEINTGSSMISAAALLTKNGAREIYACATHGVLPGEAANRMSVVSEIKEIVITDTVPVPDEKRTPKITVLPVADLLGEAIYRIHNGLSVGALFT
jgi:ribose-phosphate pyrophosphokinase